MIATTTITVTNVINHNYYCDLHPQLGQRQHRRRQLHLLLRSTSTTSTTTSTTTTTTTTTTMMTDGDFSVHPAQRLRHTRSVPGRGPSVHGHPLAEGVPNLVGHEHHRLPRGPGNFICVAVVYPILFFCLCFWSRHFFSPRFTAVMFRFVFLLQFWLSSRSASSYFRPDRRSSLCPPLTPLCTPSILYLVRCILFCKKSHDRLFAHVSRRAWVPIVPPSSQDDREILESYEMEFAADRELKVNAKTRVKVTITMTAVIYHGDHVHWHDRGSGGRPVCVCQRAMLFRLCCFCAISLCTQAKRKQNETAGHSKTKRE